MNETRRRFLRRAAIATATLPLGAHAYCLHARLQGPREPLPDCEWCGAAEAPPEASWRATVAPEGEPGTPLVVSGVVYGPDGTTPAEGVLLYVYQTNAKGIYPKRGDETGNGRRHGHLRAWMRTGADGRYEFRTIRPGSYPLGNNPAHIHATVSGPGLAEGWLEDFFFADDPLLGDEERAKSTERGRFGHVLRPERGADGTLRAVRDIRVDSARR